MSEITENPFTIFIGMMFKKEGPNKRPAIKYPVTLGSLKNFPSLPKSKAEASMTAVAIMILLSNFGDSLRKVDWYGK